MIQLKPCPFCGCNRMSMYPLDEKGFMLYNNNAYEYGKVTGFWHVPIVIGKPS